MNAPYFFYESLYHSPIARYQFNYNNQSETATRVEYFEFCSKSQNKQKKKKHFSAKWQSPI